MVSIAYDDDSVKVKAYVDINRLLWHNCIETSRTDRHQIVQSFGVLNYPTFVLIDPNGKIISRGIGQEALTKIESILAKKQ